MVTMVSILTCPDCGHQSAETMAEDSCQWFFDCPGFGRRTTPQPGQSENHWQLSSAIVPAP